MKFVCAYCGSTADKPTGHVKRSRAQGMKLYCDRRCSGFARRQHKTKAQRVEEKRLYDIGYRERTDERRKALKRAYYERTYDPAKAAEYRKQRMHLHVEYCQRPEYRRYKQGYDKRYRAGKLFGPFAEAFMLLGDLETEIASRMSKYEIMLRNGTLNKALRRRREHAAFVSGRP